VNLKGLTLRQRARILTWLARKLGVSIAEVEREIDKSGIPIRAADVIVPTRVFA